MTTTTTPTTGVSLLHATHSLAAHLDDHQLPAPASLHVLSGPAGHAKLTVQLQSTTMAALATDLLAWAGTLTVVTADAWRPAESQWVHLSLLSTLTGPAGIAELDVFGAAEDPGWFADLQPGERRTVSLAQLRTWADSNAIPDGHGVQR